RSRLWSASHCLLTGVSIRLERRARETALRTPTTHVATTAAPATHHTRRLSASYRLADRSCEVDATAAVPACCGCLSPYTTRRFILAIWSGAYIAADGMRFRPVPFIRADTALRAADAEGSQTTVRLLSHPCCIYKSS